jgi:5'-3' exonuclease
MKIYLVDGTYELFRSHFGQPPRLAPDGMHVSAVRGLIQTLLSMIKKRNVTHIAVAFDSEVKSFRNDLYSGYKDGSETPEELRMQFTLAERVVAALGITYWPMIEFEADDALGTAAVTYSQEKQVDQVLICTPDKDLSQVVSGNRVVCFDRRKNLILDEFGVIQKFGVSPQSIPDYLGLMGDSSDGIPGIPKWGAKASSILLARYESIEKIPKDYRWWDVDVRGASALSQSLEENRVEAAMFKRLATLRLDVPISKNIGTLEWKGADPNLFPQLCEELGMPNLSRQPHIWIE